MKTFVEWVNHDDGNEAGMTIRDAVGDPETLRWMRLAWDEAIKTATSATYTTENTMTPKVDGAN